MMYLAAVKVERIARVRKESCNARDDCLLCHCMQLGEMWRVCVFDGMLSSLSFLSLEP
jgi:hypothetical protein